MRKKYAQIVSDIVPDDQLPFEPIDEDADFDEDAGSHKKTRDQSEKTARGFSSIREFVEWLTEVDGSIVMATSEFGHKLDDHVVNNLNKAADLIGDSWNDIPLGDIE